MFVWSMKTTRSHIAAFGVVLCLLAVVLATGRGGETATASVGGDDAKRVAYLQQQGYEVAAQWTEVREVTVPTDETIPSLYRGKRVKRFTYATAAGENVYLYEYDGKIVGTSEQGNDDGTTG